MKNGKYVLEFEAREVKKLEEILFIVKEEMWSDCRNIKNDYLRDVAMSEAHQLTIIHSYIQHILSGKYFPTATAGDERLNTIRELKDITPNIFSFYRIN